MSITFFVEKTLALIVEMSLPILMVATIVGLIISIIQALTQIQEQTLPQVAKIVAVAALLLIAGSSTGELFSSFMTDIFNAIVRI